MFYYLVEKIGDGTEGNAFRPNYDGAFVWNPDAICPQCNTYIIGLPYETDILNPVSDIEVACNNRGLTVEEVETWFVGGS